MSHSEQEYAEKIISICKKLHQRNLLAAADGNISHRLPNDTIMITPSGLSKVDLVVEDMALLDLEGNILKGNPSSEKSMHLRVYQECPEARAVVHAHPPTAIAWTVANPELDFLPAECLSELILAVGDIPITPYARPGTATMGEVLVPFLKTYRALILARHGALTWGESIAEAHRGMERVEHVSEILYKAKILGGLTTLSKEEVTHLREMRKKIGPTIL
ncbi:MAG: aldolase [Halobacteriovoraceae bacterium]|nr:aldolase [Halobacteriovoraceae bacterium]|tara:strand:- start:23171 stop:23827 length:657 start_codon:yes stop_codon:yes gene_type:complete